MKDRSDEPSHHERTLLPSKSKCLTNPLRSVLSSKEREHLGFREDTITVCSSEIGSILHMVRRNPNINIQGNISLLLPSAYNLSETFVPFLFQFLSDASLYRIGD